MAVVAGVQASLGLQSAAFVTGLNQATAAMNNMAANANTAANNVNQSFAKVSASTRAMRGQFQNLAFQLQDVAVSLQMGMDPMRVFTQQAGQIAQIFGPMGAAIGVALTVVGGLGGALLGASSAMRKTAEEADNLNVALDRQIITLDKSIEAYLQLNNTQREALQFKLETQFFTQADALNALQIQLDETATAYTSTAAAQLSLGENAGVVQQLVGEFLTGARDVKDFASGVRELAEASDNEAIDSLAVSVGEMAIKLVETQSGMDETRVRLQALDRLGRGAAGGINELTGALNSLNPAAAAATAKLADLELEVSKAVESGLTKEVMDERKAIEERTQATKEAEAEAKRLAKTRTKTFEDLKVEQAQLERVGAAYGVNAQAVRDAQVMNEAHNKARQAGIKLGSTEFLQILKATDAIRTQADANKESEDALNEANREKERQVEATKDFNASLNNTLALQQLLLGGLDQESEAYRVQERLLKERERLGRNLTAQEQDRIRLIEQQATAIDKQQEAAKEAEKIFDNMVESMQSALADTFEDMFRDGVTSFQDLADSITDIFVRMAAELAAKKIMEAALDPAGFIESFKGLMGTAAQQIPAMAPGGGLAGWQMGLAGGQSAYGAGGGLAGWQQGLSGGPPAYGVQSGQMGGWGGYFGGGGTSGAVAGGVTGAGIGFAMGSTLFRTQEGGTHTGAAVGGTIGGAAGGAAFGPAGAMAGGALGGFIGRQFGAGKGQDNKVFFQGQLGIGAGGTGAAAALVTGIDDSIKALLTATEEGVTNRLLEVAAGVRAQYDKEMSANDMANLARGRIGPAAQAIGLTPHAASRITVGSPEQQLANLQSAVEILKQLESFKIGPAATQLRDLNAQFDALREEGERLGMSTAGLRAEQARAVAALTRQINLEKIRVAEQVGVMSPVNAALQTLAINFAEAKAQATALGISTANLAQEQAVAEAALRRQADLERIAVAETVGTISPLNAALAVLAINFAEARAQATALGIAIPNIAAKQAEQEAEIRVRFAPPSRAPEPRKIVDPRERVQIAAQVGAIGELGAAQATLAIDMREAGVEARRLGISTRNLAKTTRLAAGELYQQDQLRRHAAIEAVGLWSPFKRALVDLNTQMGLARIEAQRLGYSTAQVAKLHRRLAEQLILQENIRLTQIAHQVGAMGDLGAALAELAANMALARSEAKATGISTKNIAQTEHLARIDLMQQDRMRRNANLEAVGLWSPLTRALADLQTQMTMARNEAIRLGYPLTRINEEHARLAGILARENQALIDQQALSIVDPFKQLLDPLQEFAKNLTLGNLNPLGQMQAAQTEFRRIAELARAGSTTAIQQLQGAGEALISQMERFGASPGGAAARIEVQSVIESVMADISQAQREASAGVEDVIRLASQRQVDTLRELINETKVVAEEIKRLRR